MVTRGKDICPFLVIFTTHTHGRFSMVLPSLPEQAAKQVEVITLLAATELGFKPVSVVSDSSEFLSEMDCAWLSVWFQNFRFKNSSSRRLGLWEL